MFKSGTVLIVGLIVTAVAYQILERVPPDALNVALGVACGIGASIPVSVGLLIALTRNRAQNEPYEQVLADSSAPVRYQPQATPPRVVTSPQQQQQPQIIVIAPPQGQFGQGQVPQNLFGTMQMPWMNVQSPMAQDGDDTVDARDWRIIGE